MWGGCSFWPPFAKSTDFGYAWKQFETCHHIYALITFYLSLMPASYDECGQCDIEKTVISTLCVMHFWLESVLSSVIWTLAFRSDLLFRCYAWILNLFCFTPLSVCWFENECGHAAISSKLLLPPSKIFENFKPISTCIIVSSMPIATSVDFAPTTIFLCCSPKNGWTY